VHCSPCTISVVNRDAWKLGIPEESLRYYTAHYSHSEAAHFHRASETELFVGMFTSDDVKRVNIIDHSQDHDVDEDEFEVHTVQPLQISQSSVGDWVLVEYEGPMFPG